MRLFSISKKRKTTALIKSSRKRKIGSGAD
jgi:hypothetical protein